MGLGGHLMWTAVAAAVKEEKDLPTLPTDNLNIITNSEIFFNNPNFTTDQDSPHFHINLSNQTLNYLEDGDRVKFKTRDHIISHYCKHLGIKNHKLKCEIYTTKKENEKAQKIINSLPREFSVIEPHSKLSWSEGRAYPFEKWQKIVDATKNKIKFVQIGEPNKRRLNNVIYLNGKTTFREVSSILRKAKLFVSSEGGLVHLANATETKSIVIYTSYHVYLPIFHYPENVSIDTSLYREEIGGYKKHHLYKNETEKHNENEIIKAINENIYSI
jgi:ADP-heptose:LPS heptosyltransferase